MEFNLYSQQKNAKDSRDVKDNKNSFHMLKTAANLM
jgi:hypothetical protein